jgi:hypothetical protein
MAEGYTAGTRRRATRPNHPLIGTTTKQRNAQAFHIGEFGLDELTDEHAEIYAAEFGHDSPSGINRGLRTLRLAMNLAYKWTSLTNWSRWNWPRQTLIDDSGHYRLSGLPLGR